MDHDELKNFLTANKMMCLGSVDSDLGPHTVPVAFMYDDGRIYVSTARQSRKVHNIKGNESVAFAVEDASRLKAVVGNGSARIVPSGGSYDELMKKLVIYLVGSLEHPYAKVMMKPDRVILEITPTHLKGWEIPPS